MADHRKKGTMSTYLLFFILALIFAGATVLLLPVYRSYQKKQQELAQLTAELNNRKDENLRLHTEVGALRNSPEAIEEKARVKFGLVKPGEKVMKYQVPGKSH